MEKEEEIFNTHTNEEEEEKSEGEDGEEEKFYRARVFILADDNDWRDVATGAFICKKSSSKNCDDNGEERALILKILEEEDLNKVLWEERITQEHSPLTVQQDTVVSWTDEEGKEAALSFESLRGCECFFDLYATFLKSTSPSADTMGNGAVEGVLPEKLDLSNLGTVRQVLRPQISGLIMTGQRRTMLAAHVLAHDYVFQILECFRLAEDLNQQEALADLAKITEGLVSLGNQSVLALVLSPDHFPQVLGLFEYSSISTGRKGYLRSLYSESRRGDLKVLFIESADVGMDELETLLDETWRLQFLRDFVFGRFVEDDDTNGFLQTLIRTDQISILRELDNVPHYYETFTKALSKDQDLQRIQVVALGFLKEYLNLARPLIPQEHFNFYQNENLLKAVLNFIKFTLQADSVDTILQGIDVLSTIAQHDPSVIRIHGGVSLLTCLINIFLNTLDARVRWNIAALIKTLTKSPEPANGNAMLMLMQLHSPANSKGLDDFLNNLYPTQANLLLQPLANSARNNMDLVYHSCDLLTFFIKNHKYRIKYLLLRSSVPQSLGNLVKSQLPYVQLAALQALRAMLDTGDDFYHRFFTKHKLFLPLLEHLHANMHSNDCVTSAILEVFTLVNNAPSSFVQHLFDLDPKNVEELGKEYSFFAALISKNNQPPSSTVMSEVTSTDLQYQRMLQQEAEDEYFSRDDDEADTLSSSSSISSASSSGGGGVLVDDSPSKKVKYSSPPPTTIN